MSNEPTREITLKRFTAGSLFSLVALGTFAVIAPFSLFCGIAAVFGADTVSFSGRPVHGVWAIVEVVILVPLFTAIFSGIAWLMAYPTVFLLGKLGPLTLRYIPSQEPNQGSRATAAREHAL